MGSLEIIFCVSYNSVSFLFLKHMNEVVNIFLCKKKRMSIFEKQLLVKFCFKPGKIPIELDESVAEDVWRR